MGRYRTGLLAMLAALTCLNTAHAAGYSNDEIRIGVMTDLNGIYADWGGQGIVTAAEMAVEDMGGSVNGVPIKILVRDDQLNADHAVAEATKLKNEHHVDMITGSTGSNVALPLQAFARKNNIVTLTSGAASTDLTNSDCSPYGVHWTYDTYALSQGSVQAILGPGHSKWYFVTADYSFGHILESQAAAAVKRAGGAVLGNALAPYKGNNFMPQLQEAFNSGAQVIALANAGEDTQRTIRQGYELSSDGSQHEMVGLLMFLTDIRKLGLYVTHGLKFTTGFYWNRNAETRAWSERFNKRDGAMPTMAQAGTYSAVFHYLKAIEKAGTDDPRTVVDTMKKMPVNDFFAKNGHIRPDGRMVHDMYLVEVKDPSQSKRAWDYLQVLKTIPGNNAFRPISETECPYLTAKR